VEGKDARRSDRRATAPADAVDVHHDLSSVRQAWRKCTPAMCHGGVAAVPAMLCSSTPACAAAVSPRSVPQRVCAFAAAQHAAVPPRTRARRRRRSRRTTPRPYRLTLFLRDLLFMSRLRLISFAPWFALFRYDVCRVPPARYRRADLRF